MRATLIAAAIAIFSVLALHAKAQATNPDVVGTNDLLCIGIWNLHATDGETLKTVRVDPQGAVSLYYVGQLKLAGLSYKQAEDTIAAAYRNAGVMNQTVVSLNRLEAGTAPSIQSAVIGPGDRLSIHMIDLIPEVRHSRLLTVSAGGNVGLPLLGQFRVVGLTESAAEDAIQRALVDRNLATGVAVSVLRLSPRQTDEPTVAAPTVDHGMADTPRAKR